MEKITRRGFIKFTAAAAGLKAVEALGPIPEILAEEPVQGKKPLPKNSIGSLKAYERQIKCSGVLVESEHVSFFAPKSGSAYARLAVPILERAYNELGVLHAGMEPDYRISVEHYPRGHRRNFGGTSGGTLFYGFENIGRWEDKPGRVPHVIGYVEEMAHTFDSACGMGAWLKEAFGNYSSQMITPRIAPCRGINGFVEDVARTDAETFDYYMKHNFRLPPNVTPNLFDRIYRHLFRMLEPSAKGRLLPRFYEEVKKSGVPETRSEAEQAYVVAGIFSKVTGRDVSKLFEDCGIRMREPEKKEKDGK